MSTNPNDLIMMASMALNYNREPRDSDHLMILPKPVPLLPTKLAGPGDEVDSHEDMVMDTAIPDIEPFSADSRQQTPAQPNAGFSHFTPINVPKTVLQTKGKGQSTKLSLAPKATRVVPKDTHRSNGFRVQKPTQAPKSRPKPKSKPQAEIGPAVLAKQYDCSVCSRHYLHKRDFEDHTTSQCGTTKPFSCPHEGCTHRGSASVFSCRSTLYKHVQKIHVGLTTCAVCSKSYVNSRDLEDHVLSKCGTTKPFPCPHEGCTQSGIASVFSSRVILYSHIQKTHEERHTCTVCSKNHARKRDLEDHMLSKCGTTKPFPCPHADCTQFGSSLSFSSYKVLCVHIKRKHEDQNDQNDQNNRHSCAVCSKTYVGKRDLEDHILSKCGTTSPYPCPHEGCTQFNGARASIFSSRTTLYNHIKKFHEGDNATAALVQTSQPCEVGMTEVIQPLPMESLNSEQNLDNHILSKDQAIVGPFQCPHKDCFEVFSWEVRQATDHSSQQSLYGHLRMKHKDDPTTAAYEQSLRNATYGYVKMHD